MCGSGYVATGVDRLSRAFLRGGLRLCRGGQCLRELSAHEVDLAFDRDHAVVQSPYVGLEPGEQSDLEAGERQRGGDGRDMGVLRRASPVNRIVCHVLLVPQPMPNSVGLQFSIRNCKPSPSAGSVDVRHPERRRRARYPIQRPVDIPTPHRTCSRRADAAECRPVRSRPPAHRHRSGHRGRRKRIRFAPTPSTVPATRAAPAPFFAPIRAGPPRSRRGPGGFRTRRGGCPGPVRGAASSSPCPRS